MVIILGIKYNDKKSISNIFIFTKFDIVKSLVTCNSHATDKNINRINKKYLHICVNK